MYDVPVSALSYVPQKKIGHNQKGTRLEPLGTVHRSQISDIAPHHQVDRFLEPSA